MVNTYVLNLKLKSCGNAKKLQESKQVNYGGDIAIRKPLDVEFSTQLWWKNDDNFLSLVFAIFMLLIWTIFSSNQQTNNKNTWLSESSFYYIRMYKYKQPDVIKCGLFGFYFEYRE